METGRLSCSQRRLLSLVTLNTATFFCAFCLVLIITSVIHWTLLNFERRLAGLDLVHRTAIACMPLGSGKRCLTVLPHLISAIARMFPGSRGQCMTVLRLVIRGALGCMLWCTRRRSWTRFSLDISGCATCMLVGLWGTGFDWVPSHYQRVRLGSLGR